jgi:hypothetical protein
MLNNPLSSSSLRLLLSEVIELNKIHFDIEKEMKKRVNEQEDVLWQRYINTLAIFGLKEWVNKKMLELPINIDNSSLFKNQSAQINEVICNIEIGDFKACVLPVEHLLDEIVFIPEYAVRSRDFAAHFYIIVEVLEEEEEVIIRSFLRYDQLIKYISLLNNSEPKNGGYEIPLSIFDMEPNHLFYYCNYLKTNSIIIHETISKSPVSTVSIESQNYANKTTTKLGKWLQDIFEESWYAIDALVSPEANLAFSTRNLIMAARRGKLIDLGMQLGHKTVALLVNITEEPEDKVGILVQLHPTCGDRYLPSNVTLKLLSKAGKTLQEVQARHQDNYIQLKPFKGESGKCFSIEVSILDIKICEKFEI